jgi:hypothetical protein
MWFDKKLKEMDMERKGEKTDQADRMHTCMYGRYKCSSCSVLAESCHG